jgi:hypothetical protein
MQQAGITIVATGKPWQGEQSFEEFFYRGGWNNNGLRVAFRHDSAPLQTRLGLILARDRHPG